MKKIKRGNVTLYVKKTVEGKNRRDSINPNKSKMIDMSTKRCTPLNKGRK